MWTTSRVSTVQCVANTLFLTLELVFGRINSLSVYRSTFTVDRKVFCTNISYPHRKLLLNRSKEESPRLSALVLTSCCLCYYAGQCACVPVHYVLCVFFFHAVGKYVHYYNIDTYMPLIFPSYTCEVFGIE